MKRERDDGEVSYWQSMADGIVGLLLVILLVLMLLMLYLMRAKEDTNLDLTLGDTYDDPQAPAGADYGWTAERAEEEEEHDEKYEEPEKDESSGGGGGGGGDGDEEETEEGIIEEYPEESKDLAAVFVQLMDEETQRTIKIEGVEFELYSGQTLQTLCTYYPVKTEYKKFKTDKNGTFYLPEKISLGAYQLHDLTEINDYDIVSYTDFEVANPYEWDDPYVVNVYMSPSKNVIQIKLKDRSDGKVLSAGKFQIIAAENIVTRDGTTRYTKDSVVDTITIGSDGTGQSKELYLGKYLIRQLEAQQYYALIKEDTEVELKKKSEKQQGEVYSLTEGKTAVNVVLQDELYAMTRIEGCSVELQDGSGKVISSGTTDEKGMIRFTDLNKNMTYQIAQKTTNEGYQLPNQNQKFSVDQDGYVNDESEANLVVTNRLIRISVGITDKLFRNQVSDINVVLMDSEDTVIKSWNSSGVDQLVSGLTPGKYKLVINGKNDSANEITVENTADIQLFKFSVVTVFDIGFVFTAVAVIVLIIILAVNIHRRKKREKELEAEE